ncbi:hypothetical protein IscW_ISCW018233, partial [Ixodes scapularis]
KGTKKTHKQTHRKKTKRNKRKRKQMGPHDQYLEKGERILPVNEQVRSNDEPLRPKVYSLGRKQEKIKRIN